MNSSKTSSKIRATTLADVGRTAGVSAMAASTVLNGARTSSRIAPKTRKRILAAAARLHYRPNAAARALASSCIHTIGVACVMDGDELNHYFLEVLGGILATAGHHEENTTVFTLHDWSADPARLRGLCDGRIDGLILVAPTLTPAAGRLLPAHTPFVALHANCPLQNVVNIESDEENGACEITRLLIDQGHRYILHLTGPRGLLGAERRIRGFKRALAGAAIPCSKALLMEASFTADSGREVMRQWLRGHAGKPLPQAVFCANDGIAIGCLEALAEVGLRVPEDISVAGFDDTLAARTTVPQLATVRQPLSAMGSRAVEVLLERIQHSDQRAATDDPNPIVFPVEVIVRASVGPPPAVARIVPALALAKH
jgi:LacI family transcriptional regulator